MVEVALSHGEKDHRGAQHSHDDIKVVKSVMLAQRKARVFS